MSKIFKGTCHPFLYENQKSVSVDYAVCDMYAVTSNDPRRMIDATCCHYKEKLFANDCEYARSTNSNFRCCKLPNAREHAIEMDLMRGIEKL